MKRRKGREKNIREKGNVGI